MGQSREQRKERDGGDWKKMKPVWEKGPPVIAAYLSPRIGVRSVGFSCLCLSIKDQMQSWLQVPGA